MNLKSIEKEFYLDLLYLYQMSNENKTTACLFLVFNFLGIADYGAQLDSSDGGHCLHKRRHGQ